MDPSISFDDSNSGHQMGINRGRVTNIYYASPYHQNETPHSQNSQPRQAERHVMIPFARNPRFVGRGNVIQNVTDQILSTDHTVARKAGVSGLGGIGKTQIALEVAHFISEKDPARSIFWIPATSLEAAEQAFHDIARRLRLPNEKQDDPKTLVNDHLNSGRAGAWLLIVDNADESNMWNTNSKTSFKGFIPHSKEGFVLYTSRNQGLLTQIVGPNIIKLEEMDESNARRLFEDHLVEKTAANDKNSTSLLLQQLCLLPLALIQAASFINENAISVQKYLEMLSQQEEELPELLEEDFENEHRYPGLENAISATWLVSFQQIKRSNDIAFQYLCFIACIDSRDIPLSILPPTKSDLLKQKAIGILKAYSFIATQVDETKYSMHRLVHLATRKWLQKECVFVETLAKVHENLLLVFPSEKPENRQLWRQYLPHVQVFLLRDEFLAPSGKKGLLASKVAICLIQDGRFHEPWVLLNSEMNKALQCGEEWASILHLAKNLLLSLCLPGRVQEAEKLGKKILETEKDRLGESHPNTLASMGIFSQVLQLQGRLQEAEQLLELVLGKQKKILGRKNSATIGTMESLSVVFQKQDRFEEAEELMTKVHKFRKKILGVRHPDTIESMDKLCYILSQSGRAQEAEELSIQVVVSREEVLGKRHPDTIRATWNHGFELQRQNRFQEAEVLLIQALESHKEVFGPEHSFTMTVMSSLAFNLEGQHRFKGAEDLHTQVVELQRKLLGTRHPETLRTMSHCVCVQAHQGKYGTATELAKQCIELSESTLEPSHPETIEMVEQLGCLIDVMANIQKIIKRRISLLPNHQIRGSLVHPLIASVRSHHSHARKTPDDEDVD